MVSIYALMTEMRMASNTNVVDKAEAVIRTILGTYSRPNKTFPASRPHPEERRHSEILCSISVRYAATSCATCLAVDNALLRRLCLAEPRMWPPPSSCSVSLAEPPNLAVSGHPGSTPISTVG